MGRMVRVAFLGYAFLTLSCSSSLAPSRDAAADSSAPPDSDAPVDAATDEPEGDAPTDAIDGGSPTVEGRVLIVQQAGVSPPTLWTRAWFALEHPCPNISGSPDCACTDSVIGGCLSRTCEGRQRAFKEEWVLGYVVGDGLQFDLPFLDAGTLAIHHGASLFAHEAPYDAHDSLSAAWQAGDAIEMSAAGATAPPFSAQVPFPPTVSFLEPDLGGQTIVLGADTLNIRWAPAQGPGSVEATIASYLHPDAYFNYTVLTCSAAVEKGELAVPVPAGGQMSASFLAGRVLSVRVINRVPVQRPGLSVDAVVASFDTGVLLEAAPNPDGGGADTGADAF